MNRIIVMRKNIEYAEETENSWTIKFTNGWLMLPKSKFDLEEFGQFMRNEVGIDYFNIEIKE